MMALSVRFMKLGKKLLLIGLGWRGDKLWLGVLGDRGGGACQGRGNSRRVSYPEEVFKFMRVFKRFFNLSISSAEISTNFNPIR
jgi:hypothetical protein